MMPSSNYPRSPPITTTTNTTTNSMNSTTLPRDNQKKNQNQKMTGTTTKSSSSGGYSSSLFSPISLWTRTRRNNIISNSNSNSNSSDDQTNANNNNRNNNNNNRNDKSKFEMKNSKKQSKSSLFSCSSASSSSSYCLWPCTTKTPCIILLAFLGILFIIIGLIFYLILLHTLLHRIISEKLAINEGSETFEKWKQIPMPVYYRYYFFNVTNPMEIERNGAKPILNEIGPFTYRSYWKKYPIIFHSNNTVTFREKKSLEFIPELSYSSDRLKNLVTVNGPLTVTLALLQKAPLVVRNIVSLGLSGVSEGFFVKRSAKELLFDGYAEVLTSFGPLLNPSIPNTKGRFGWLYGRNNTDDGLFTVYTGKDDITKINKIDRYNRLKELNYWKSNSHCNKLQDATDGQIIAINERKTFKLFHPELCRTIRFNADEIGLNSTYFVPRDSEQKSSSDIKFTVDRYIPDIDTLSSMDDYPPNSCYLSKITPSKPELGDIFVSINRQRDLNQNRFQIKPFFRIKNGRIIFRSGVFDMSECKYGAPVLFSYPHFLNAHPNYRENIGGLRPDKRKHQFHMMIEPITGTSIRSYARIQINIYITKPPWLSRFRYVPEVVFPVFWQELRAEASMNMIEHINWALTKPFLYADLFSIMLIVIGLLLVSLSGYLMFCMGKKSSNHQDFIKKNQNHSQNQKPDLIKTNGDHHDDDIQNQMVYNELEMQNGITNQSYVHDHHENHENSSSSSSSLSVLSIPASNNNNNNNNDKNNGSIR